MLSPLPTKCYSLLLVLTLGDGSFFVRLDDNEAVRAGNATFEPRLSEITVREFVQSRTATCLSQSVLSLGCGRFSETERRATKTSAIIVSSAATNNSPVPAEISTRAVTSA